MLLSVLLFAGLASASAPAPPPAARSAGRVQVLLLDLESTEPKATVELLGGSIASALTKRENVEAITAADLRAMTKLEASKSAAGCDETSCLAELAAALGARYVMYGRLGPLGDELVLQLNLFDANASRAVAREERRARDLSALSRVIPEIVDALLVPIAAPPGPDERPPAMVAAAVLAVAGSAVALGAGTGALYLESSLWSPDSSVDDKELALAAGPWLWGTVIVAAVVGTIGTTILFLPAAGSGA